MILTPIKAFEGHRQGFLMNINSWCEKCECDAVRSERRTSYRFETRFPSEEGKEAKTVEKFYLIQQSLDIVTTTGLG